MAQPGSGAMFQRLPEINPGRTDRDQFFRSRRGMLLRSQAQIILLVEQAMARLVRSG